MNQVIYFGFLILAKFQVNPDWKLITSEELTNQEKLLKNATNSQSPNAIALMRDKEKVSLQLTPAQIYKIIVSKYR